MPAVRRLPPRMWDWRVRRRQLRLCGGWAVAGHSTPTVTATLPSFRVKKQILKPQRCVSHGVHRNGHVRGQGPCRALVNVKLWCVCVGVCVGMEICRAFVSGVRRFENFWKLPKTRVLGSLGDTAVKVLLNKSLNLRKCESSCGLGFRDFEKNSPTVFLFLDPYF